MIPDEAFEYLLTSGDPAARWDEGGQYLEVTADGAYQWAERHGVTSETIRIPSRFIAPMFTSREVRDYERTDPPANQGDTWTGNFVACGLRRPWIIDDDPVAAIGRHGGTWNVGPDGVITGQFTWNVRTSVLLGIDCVAWALISFPASDEVIRATRRWLAELRRVADTGGDLNYAEYELDRSNDREWDPTAISYVATKIGASHMKTTVPDQIGAVLLREPNDLVAKYDGWWRSRFELYAVGLPTQAIV